MPKNTFQKIFYAFLTVLFTVHAFVFYSLFVVNASVLTSVNHVSSVTDAITKQGGIYVLGSFFPIWLVIVMEFILAFVIELLLGGPCSFRLTNSIIDTEKSSPLMFELVMISTTVFIMCPIMSFLAAILYYPFYEGFHVLTLITNWLKLLILNFPFALLSQIFFIQPLVRRIFRCIIR